MTLTVKVISAEYLSGYKLLIQFSDHTQQIVDFENFLNANPHPQHNKYKNQEQFKTFKIEKGTIVWGKDWDLIFPVEQLHAGHIEI